MDIDSGNGFDHSNILLGWGAFGSVGTIIAFIWILPRYLALAALMFGNAQRIEELTTVLEERREALASR